MTKTSGTDTIIIARHGKPDLSRKIWLSASEYKTWWARYDTVGLADGQVPPPNVRELANHADMIISSSLPRAVETAAAAGGRAVDRQDANLIEAPLPPPNLGPIKMIPILWGTLSRITWWLGFSAGQETRQEAEIRAQVVAQSLMDEAGSGRLVFVAAHGWFNRMLKKPLTRAGFKCVEDHGDRYWSYRRYERPSG